MWRKSVKVDSRRASWNVRTGSFFIGIFGFSISLFFLLAMTLAHYNAIPAVIGMITYSFLIFAEFTGKPGFYLAFIGINTLGIIFYGAVSLFLVVMLVQMPNWYVTFVKYHVIEGSEVQYSVEICRTITELNLGFCVVGSVFSAYGIYIVHRAYKLTLELINQRE